MKTIDLEAHYYPPALIELLSSRTEYPRYIPEDCHIIFRDGYYVKNKTILPRLFQSMEERVAYMDEFGIDTQILSVSPGIELLETPLSVKMARAANEYVYTAMNRYPGRFLGFASLPVNDTEESLRELERCIRQLGLLGWNTFSNYGASSPDENKYRPLFELSAQLKTPVYLHPTDPFFGRFFGLGPQLSSAALGFGVDTSITLMRLILSGVFDDNPELKLLLGHLGESLPFTLERMDGRCKLDIGPPAQNRHLPSYYFKNSIYVTTSGQYSHEAFRCARDVLGIDRILFATDYPYESPEEVRAFTRSLRLSEIERERLFFKNAEELFGVTF